jgi:organic hydroperoxide reductase OsmC/OhrA
VTRRIALRFGRVSGRVAVLARSAGGHTRLADRPPATSGQENLGFNGAELPAAAPGGCYWTDLRRAVATDGDTLAAETLDSEIDLAETPPRVARSHPTAVLVSAAQETLDRIFRGAEADSTIPATLSPAFPTHFTRQPAGAGA